MKKTDKFQVSSVWWKNAKPAALLSSGLGAALTAYESARGKLNAERSTFDTAKAALAAVEAARLKAIKNCGAIFPDAKTVLTNGKSEITTEETDLGHVYEGKVKTALDPLKTSLTNHVSICKRRLANATQGIANVPADGARTGAKHDDEKQKKMEAFVTLLSGYEGALLASVNDLNGQTTRSKAALKNADAGIDIVKEVAALDKEANEQIPEARRLMKEVRVIVQDWVAELKTVNPGFAFKERHIN